MQQSLLWELWHSWEDGIGWSGGEFSRIANCYRVFLGVLQLVADNLDHHQARTTEVQSWTVVKIDCGMYSSSSSAVTAERKVHTWVLGQFGLAEGSMVFCCYHGSEEKQKKILAALLAMCTTLYQLNL
jgi:hypothetical protein